MNVDVSPEINILSICSGVGGLDLGLGLALPAARTVCYVEREAYCCEILASRMEDEALDDAPIWSDLATFDGHRWHGLVDGIIGGMPCQPHSVAGKRLGAGDERDLWPATARIIGEVEPSFMFLENVSGAAGYFCGRVGGELDRMGYRVAAGLFTASEVGASHKRERLFMLADRKSDHRWGISKSGSIRGAKQEEKSMLTGGYGCNVADRKLARREETGQRCNINAGVESQAGSGNVADAGGERPQGDGETWAKARAVGQCGGAEIPLFAPGPADLDAWREILEIDPTLEPAVCGVADGVADRLERLRACGNGVVALQAAWAFVCLAAALRG